MESDIRIRPERPADHGRTFEVEQAAFGSRLQPDLVEALRTSADPQLSLVAEVEGGVVGHIFFSPATIDSEREAPPAAQLSPVAVDPRHQRSGAGSALIRAGLERCPSKGWSAVFLVGNPLYYSRFGFKMAGPLGFTHSPQEDPFLQVLELQPGALDGVRGRVWFHSAFAEIGAE